MRLHAAGRPIPRADLPDPPGFGPIPVSDAPAAAVAAMPAASQPTAGAPRAAPQPPGQPTKTQAPTNPKVARQSSSATMSLQEKQLAGLQKRQTMFKQAALGAKQQGQTDTAKEYLRQALSFNKLIEVSRAGIPVDMATLPVPPQMQVKTNMDFEIVSREECEVVGDREEMYS